MSKSTDRHKTPRVFPSGAKRRKNAATKAQREIENLSKVPKLNSYFLIRNEAIPHTSIHSAVGDSNDHPNPRNPSCEPGIRVIEPKIVEINVVDDVAPTKINGFGDDVGLWPEVPTSEMMDFWAKKGSRSLQNCDGKLFEKSSRIEDVRSTDLRANRTCSASLFKRRNKNSEIVDRFWLSFSPTTGNVYCYVCKLIANHRTQLSGEGYNDWKHASERISEHEITKNHLEFWNWKKSLAKRGRIHERIDVELARQEVEEGQYWREVLMRVVSTIKFIAERGLAFRGNDKLIGSTRNGNFLGIIELLAEYDPFLSTHLKEKANRGSGHVNYLSSTVCEPLITLMGEKVLDEIIRKIKKSKYYLISVDSTPDEAHIDQLTIVIRCMEECTPRERFLIFLPNCGHTGLAIANALLQFLTTHNININDCRVQSYDNAANMAGKYRGMQALILEKNNLAVFIACSGKAGANSCAFAVQFFDFVQNIYTFFTATLERYAIMVEKLSTGNRNFRVPKSLSDTRWSCRADAMKALIGGYGTLKETLDEISQDEEQKDIIRIEVRKLCEKMCSLEIAFYAIFWNEILERFNATNKILQDPKMVLHSAVTSLKFLRSFVESKRDKFNEYQKLAQELSGSEDYTRTRSRKRNVRLNPLDSSQSADSQISYEDKFRIESYNPVIDRLYAALTDRLRAYETVCSRFDFFNCLEQSSDSELKTAADNLVKVYPDDLGSSLANELVQFKSLIDTFKEDPLLNESKEVFYYRNLVDSNFGIAFPNIQIALRIYLVLMVSNCSGERSFSKMKTIKNRLRTTMTQQRLSWLALLSIESDLLRELDFTEVINDFAAKNARKVALT